MRSDRARLGTSHHIPTGDGRPFLPYVQIIANGKRMTDMLDDKLARVKTLIAKREEIDAELAEMFGVEPRKPRGRRPKSEQATLQDGDKGAAS